MSHLYLNDFVNNLPGGNIWFTVIVGSFLLYFPVIVHFSKGRYGQAISSFGQLTMAVFLVIPLFFTTPLAISIFYHEWKLLTTATEQPDEK